MTIARYLVLHVRLYKLAQNIILEYWEVVIGEWWLRLRIRLLVKITYKQIF